MKIIPVKQLELFEDSPGVSQTVRDILSESLTLGDAVSLLDLSERAADHLGCNRDKITVQVRQTVERIEGFELITINTDKGKRTFIANVGVS